ncbi:MAG: secretin N-terminal domain-containing protein [Vulcanimicrobiaceae bacterium]
MMNRLLVLLLCLVLAESCGVASAGQADKITLTVNSADLGSVVAFLASQAHRNIVLDASVKPTKITLQLRNVTFDQALSAIAAANELEVRTQSGVLILGSADAMNREGNSGAAPFGASTVVLGLRYADPMDVVKALSPAVSSGTVLVADARTRSVIVSADPITITRVRALTKALDRSLQGRGVGVPTKLSLRFIKPSVLLAHISGLIGIHDATADDARNMLLISGDARARAIVARYAAQLDVAPAQVLFEVKVVDVTPTNRDMNVGLEFGGVDFKGAPSIGSTTYTFANRTIPILARLNALVSDGHAQILATPRVTTLNNQEAKLLIGETYPVVTQSSAFSGQQVQYVDIGVKLRVTPMIGSDGSVTAELHPEYSELVGVTQAGFPIVANRKIDATLRVRDGETIVLGGLMRDVSSETISRVPWVSDIPILGQVFKNRQMHHERDEVVFLITPHVIAANARPPAK